MNRRNETDEHIRLHESIEKNRDLLIEIKDDLGKELNLLKLSHEKLKFLVYGLAGVVLVGLGSTNLQPLLGLI